MSIEFTVEDETDFTLVSAQGGDVTSQDALRYGQSLMHAAQRAAAVKVLIDHRSLDYAIGVEQVSELIKQIAPLIPSLKRIAVVCPADALVDGKAWQSVAFHRGPQVLIDDQFDRARRWLLE